ncbi:MAG TPA: glucosyl-3-phosphoglycerate synthase [Mycobacteriales bacterium]|nr:glucosyl-3-phosphoglycerate synthase [Mycobacteriales bacterium]
MRTDVRRWFDRRTYDGAGGPSVAELVAAKTGSVSVILPARDEAATVGGVVRAIRPLQAAGLVDELLVLDDGSRDGTAAVAARAGAEVIATAGVLPGYGTRPGKGDVLWKALHVSTGDIVVYLDADLQGVSAAWVTGLIWPLLAEPAVQLVKACYDRPLALPDSPVTPGGGRVTELAARPLINLLWPQLAGVIQPLAGEYAARRGLLERLPYDSGYAVELGLLVDALAAVGLDGLAQVDLGIRRHRHQGTDALGRMAAGIVAAALERSGVELQGHELVQFVRAGAELIPVEAPIRGDARPPMLTVPEYAARRAQAS